MLPQPGPRSRVGYLPQILALTSFLLAAVVAAVAQTDQGRIAGAVRDQNNAILPGASVTVKNERTGETRTATSNAEGLFIVTNLKPSSYLITVSASGFAKTEYNNV